MYIYKCIYINLYIYTYMDSERVIYIHLYIIDIYAYTHM